MLICCITHIFANTTRRQGKKGRGRGTLECTPASVVLVVGVLCVDTSAIPTQVIICAHHALVATVQNWVHAASEAGGGGGKGAANTVRNSSTVSLLVMVVRDTTPTSYPSQRTPWCVGGLGLPRPGFGRGRRGIGFGRRRERGSALLWDGIGAETPAPGGGAGSSAETADQGRCDAAIAEGF